MDLKYVDKFPYNCSSFHKIDENKIDKSLEEIIKTWNEKCDKLENKRQGDYLRFDENETIYVKNEDGFIVLG